MGAEIPTVTTHPDGTKCIWMDDNWFVPVAAGEVYTCEQFHPERSEVDQVKLIAAVNYGLYKSAEIDVDTAEKTVRMLKQLAWDEGYRFGRIMQFDADWYDRPKWARHNSRNSLLENLDHSMGRNHDNPYRKVNPNEL